MTVPIRLEDRGVLKITGEDRAAFLQGLLTNDVERLGVGEAAFAALLSPQGKILFDMIVAAVDDGFYIDVARAQSADLAKRLGFYKLRAKVAVADVSGAFGVGAVLGEGAAPAGALAHYADPRDARLGQRFVAPTAALAALSAERAAYDEARIALGVPEGGVDFAFGDAFPADANMDLLHGVDYSKGCFVGQEVVARMRHKGGVKKRVVRLQFSAAAPPPGTPVTDGELALGALGLAQGGQALAILRIDRLEEAKAAGRALRAGGAEAMAV